MHKTSCCLGEVPFCFSRSSVKCQVHGIGCVPAPLNLYGVWHATDSFRCVRDFFKPYFRGTLAALKYDFSVFRVWPRGPTGGKSIVIAQGTCICIIADRLWRTNLFHHWYPPPRRWNMSEICVNIGWTRMISGNTLFHHVAVEQDLCDQYRRTNKLHLSPKCQIFPFYYRSYYKFSIHKLILALVR